MKHVDDCQGEQMINLMGLFVPWKKGLELFTQLLITGQTKDELTIERVCLLMNIVPYNDMDLAS